MTDNTLLFRERNWIKYAKLGVDILSLQVSLHLGYLLRQLFNPWLAAQINFSQYRSLMLAMLLVPLGYWMAQLYPGYGLSSVERLRRRVKTTVAFLLLFIFWDFIFNHSVWSRGILLSTFFFALIVPPVLQSFFRVLMVRLNIWGTPVIILGAGRTGEHVATSLVMDPSIGFRPVLIFDDDGSKEGTRIAGVPVFCGLKHANDFADVINNVIMAIPGAKKEFILGLWQSLPFHNIIIVPDLIGLQSLWVDARDLGGVIGLEIRKNLLLRRNRILKRFMDYFLGIPFFVVSVPMLVVFAFWIKMTSQGPALYCQVREGYRGRKIKVWKLRTMYHDADRLLKEHFAANPEAKNEWSQYFKLKDDPRIVKGIGNFLRKTSMDELPQLWNVLRGELSLVGPRPFPHYHLEEFDTEFRQLRRSVMPGLTGLWQVSARSDGDLAVQKRLDTYYIRNWSIWLDLSLLGRTFLTVFTGRGAY